MAVLMSKDKKELIVNCRCGCNESMRIKIDDSFGDYSYMSYLNGNFAKEQCDRIFGRYGVIARKLSKIWAVIANKDHYYSDVVMSKEDFEELKKFINQY